MVSTREKEMRNGLLLQVEVCCRLGFVQSEGAGVLIFRLAIMG
jgi:hypothetical protein